VGKEQHTKKDHRVRGGRKQVGKYVRNRSHIGDGERPHTKNTKAYFEETCMQGCLKKEAKNHKWGDVQLKKAGGRAVDILRLGKKVRRVGTGERSHKSRAISGMGGN